MVYLLAIMGRSEARELAAFCERFQIPQKSSDRLLWQKVHADKTAHLLTRRQVVANSEIYWLLKELSNEGLLYLMAIARKNQIRRAVSHYVTTLRQIRPELTGNDLMALGYQPGPEFKEMLNDLLTARLDGLVSGRQQEITFITKAYPLPSLAEKKPSV
jgi:tRNA nucleotidyltransferase (CCA-adding enzyme)